MQPTRTKKVSTKDQTRWSWSRRKRPVLLAALLAILAVVFFLNGGISGFANSMAETAILSDDLDKADGWLRWARFVSNGNGKTEYLSAKLARLRGDLETMSKCLKQSLEHGFDPQLLDREQTLALASGGKLTPEIELKLKLWISQKPPDVSNIVDCYANGLASLSRFDDISVLLGKYGEEFPSDPVVDYRLGLISEHLMQFKRAENDYLVALTKDPKHVGAAFGLSRILVEKQELDEAIKRLRSIDYGVQSLVVNEGLAKLYHVQGKVDESRELYLKVLKSSREEIEHSHRYMGLNPARFGAAAELGTLELECGNFEEAKKYLSIALEAYPMDYTAGYSYAIVLNRLGLTKEAEECRKRTERSQEAFNTVTTLKARIQSNANDVEARVEIGKLLREFESDKIGIFWIRSALAHDPSHKEAHRILAEYCAQPENDTPANREEAAYHRSFLQE